MKAVIVGTAGHIDHGKSALVRALTGTDPDRLEEEKRRGITIDLGFASLNLTNQLVKKEELTNRLVNQIQLGFVDVPGHERFVRNMLAGVGGIDVVLLVIAADEGVKPQTREHFDICRLLAVQRGITVLTKSDLVDEDTVQVVRSEIADFVQGSFLDGAPIVAVSSKTGAGLDELRSELAQVAAEVPAKDANAVLRLPVDRVFTMKGFGTVVTGTLISGTVHKEQELEVQPGGKRLRVRGVQVHGAAAEHALAGERTALNLAGVETSELARGMMLTASGMFRPATRVGVSLDLLRFHPIAPKTGAMGTPASAKPLRDRARVHLHAFTAETIAEVSLLGAKELAPGQSGMAELKLADPLLLLPGDRFIIRQFSPVITIGGGRILDALRPAKRARAQERLAFLKTLTNATGPESLLARVGRRGAEGLGIKGAVAETGWLPPRVENFTVELVSAGKLARFEDRLVAPEVVKSIARAAMSKVDQFHQANPLLPGIGKEELRESLGLSHEVFRGVLDTLVHEKKLQVGGEVVHAAGKGVSLRDEETEAKQKIEQAFASSGLKVPLLKDVLASLPIDKVRAQKIVTLLLRDRVLVKLSDELVFHRDALTGLRTQIVAQKVKTPKLDVAKFKDLFGITRKHAIPLLEYLDRERVTRRVGDERIIL